MAIELARHDDGGRFKGVTAADGSHEAAAARRLAGRRIVVGA